MYENKRTYLEITHKVQDSICIAEEFMKNLLFIRI